MARVRFMSWNIQNYGTGGRYTRGPISTWLNRFIAAVVAHYNVDVFAIMELTPGRRFHLGSLLGKLNDQAGQSSWCFDYLPERS